MAEFLKLSQNKANIKQAADQVKNAQKSGSAAGSSKSALPNMGDREVKTNSIFTSGSGSTATTKNSVSGQDFVEALSGKGIQELDKAQKAQFDLLAAFADEDGNEKITNEEATVLDLTEDGKISQADIDAIYEELGIGSDASVDELLDAIDDILNDRETAATSGSGSTGAAASTGSTSGATGTGSTGATSGTGSTGATSGTGSTGATSGTGSTGATSGTGSTGATSGTGSTGATTGTGSTAATSSTTKPEEVEEENGISTENTGVKRNEDGTYSVTVETFRGGKVQEDGDVMRYPNGSFWGIVTNAYPEISEADKEKVYEMIGEMNDFDWNSHVLQTGEELKMPILEYDENGRVTGYHKESEVKEAEETEKPQSTGSTASTGSTNATTSTGSTGATSGTTSTGSTGATSGTTSTGSTGATSGTGSTGSTGAAATTKPSTQNATDRATISENEVGAKITELHSAMAGWGTNEAKIDEILKNSNYSDADIMMLMDAYEKQYGESLMHDIQGDYSGKSETELRELLYSSAENEAQKVLGWNNIDDIPTDIAAKANEFYTELESSDALSYMSEFDKLTDTEKAQILVACDMLHGDEASVSRVTEGKVWFGKEDGYVDRMLKALKNTAIGA